MIIHLNKVRLLSLDVDGVQTDCSAYYTEDGQELRRFNVRDGMGISNVLAIGIPVIFITTSKTPSITARANKLKITRCIEGCENKLAALTEFCVEQGIDLAHVAHMGDDVNDLAVLRAVGIPVTVANAMPELADIVIWKSRFPGGNGAVREFCDLLVRAHKGKGRFD